MSSRASSLASLWTTDEPPAPTPPARTLPGDAIGRAVAWPLAIILVLHRVCILAINGSITDDFSTVYFALRRFHESVPIYNENYDYVDPHYLYSPGATLLLSPLGLLTDFQSARTAFVAVNAAAIIAALGLLTRMFGFRLSSMVWPAAIALAFLTEAVRNTLIFSNINGLLLLASVGYLWLLLHNKQLAAGVAVGLAALIKPIFLPLLFLPLVKWQWKTIVSGLAVPVVANAVAWPFVPGAGDYVSRDYANSSLSGQAVFYDMPGWQVLFWQVVFALSVIVAVVCLLRFRYSDPLMWAASTSGVLLTGVFFLSSLGQMYYSMLLFPLLFTVLCRRSIMHAALAWVAAYLFLSPENWVLNNHDLTVLLDYAKPTFGWGLMLIVAATVSCVWVVQDLRGRKTS